MEGKSWKLQNVSNLSNCLIFHAHQLSEWMACCAPMCDVKRLANDSFDNLRKSLISLTPDTFSKHDPIFKTLLTHRSCIVCAFYWAPRGFYSSPPRLLIIIKSLKMVKNENEFPRRFMFILRFRLCWALSIISSPSRTKRLICYLFSKRARFRAYTMTSSSYSLRKAHYAREHVIPGRGELFCNINS